jgi:ribosomal protein L7/L12
MVIVVIIVLAFIVAGVIVVAKGASDVKFVRERTLSLSEKYKLDVLYVSPIDRGAVGIDFDQGRLIFESFGADVSYGFSEISAIAVVQNGSTITQTDRGSQLLGAAVGGLAFGGLGAVVGGLSGSSHARARLSSVFLKITVDDRVQPMRTICFLRQGKRGIDPNSIIATQALASVERIHAHLVNAMRQVQRGVTAPPLAVDADQLQKLWDMHQAGALTGDEFAEQKARLLGGGKAAGEAIRGPVSPTGFSVILVAPGPRKINLIRALRGVRPELDLASLKRLVEAAPAVIATGLNAAHAEQMKRMLVGEGAVVNLQAAPDAPDIVPALSSPPAEPAPSEETAEPIAELGAGAGV